jgi:histone arginine demethylase JMJD6
MKFEIERRSNLSYEQFAKEYLYPLKPVIVTDAMKEWKAMGKWTPEFFKREFPDMKFTIKSAEYGQAGYKKEGDTYTMPQFVDLVMASTDEKPAPYFRNRMLYEEFPTLKADIQPLPEYFQPNWLTDKYAVKRIGDVLNRGAIIEIYIGGKGGAFPVLHYDGAGTHAFLMQIYGRKEYVIYPPDHDRFLYPNPDKPNLSMVNNLDKPDLSKFPLFAQAEATKLILEPGELLFVPSHWWHTAKMLTPSITISINTLNESNWHELVAYVGLKKTNPIIATVMRAYLNIAGSRRASRDRAWKMRAQ